jgi:hypothetical protein
MKTAIKCASLTSEKPTRPVDAFTSGNEIRQGNEGKIRCRFGNAWLIKLADGRHELVGGTEGNFTEAKEWVSLFAHEIVFKRSAK